MIDIIIPTYNSIDTLDATLDSIRIQKDVPKLKVYIVDDCSEYDYGDIISKYNESLDILFMKNNENRGPGFTRNEGLKISSDEYIVFIDSDDVLYDDNSISKLYHAISDSNSDVVTSVIYEEQDKDNNIVYENEMIGLHGKIYRRKFIEENNISFLETYCNEDFYFNSLLILCGASIYNISDVTYIWKDNDKSITRRNSNENLNNDCFYYSLAAIKALQFVLKKSNQDINVIIDYCCKSLSELVYKILLIPKGISSKKAIKNFEKILFIYEKLGPDEDFVKYLLDNNYFSENNLDGINLILNEIKDKKEKLSDYQRAKKSMVHFPLDNEFGDIRIKNMRMLREFNQMEPYDYFNPDKQKLLKKMFGYYDYSSVIEPPIDANWGCKNVYIGKNCYINSNVFFEDDGNIYIGDNVFVGKGTHFITVNHVISPNLRSKHLLYSKDIHIGDNTWIGSNVTILPGVNIGKCCVIGAGSVVTKDIPDNMIVGGNPCKVIRSVSLYDELFYDDELIDI